MLRHIPCGRAVCARERDWAQWDTTHILSVWRRRKKYFMIRNVHVDKAHEKWKFRIFPGQATKKKDNPGKLPWFSGLFPILTIPDIVQRYCAAMVLTETCPSISSDGCLLKSFSSDIRFFFSTSYKAGISWFAKLSLFGALYLGLRIFVISL